MFTGKTKSLGVKLPKFKTTSVLRTRARQREQIVHIVQQVVYTENKVLDLEDKFFIGQCNY